jgi:hypothetical protein
MPHNRHDTRIESGIADLKLQSGVNYAATARKWDVERTPLASAIRAKQAQLKTPIHICYGFGHVTTGLGAHTQIVFLYLATLLPSSSFRFIVLI